MGKGELNNRYSEQASLVPQKGFLSEEGFNDLKFLAAADMCSYDTVMQRAFINWVKKTTLASGEVDIVIFPRGKENAVPFAMPEVHSEATIPVDYSLPAGLLDEVKNWSVIAGQPAMPEEALRVYTQLRYHELSGDAVGYHFPGEELKPLKKKKTFQEFFKGKR